MKNRFRLYFICILLVLLPAGLIIIGITACQCGGGLNPVSEGLPVYGEEAIWVWCAVDKDCHTNSREYHSTPLPGATTLGISTWDGPRDKRRRAFVHFYLPEFPEGIVVEEAYVNTYDTHTCQIPPDDRNAYSNCMTIGEQWDPYVVCHDNIHDQGGRLTLKLGNPAGNGNFDISGFCHKWWGSKNIHPHSIDIQYWLDHPGENYGIYLGENKNKKGTKDLVLGCRSDNHPERAAMEMDRAPRLILKIRYHGELNKSNVIMPALPSDTDLGERIPDGDVLMVKFATGPKPPKDWEVNFGW